MIERMKVGGACSSSGSSVSSFESSHEQEHVGNRVGDQDIKKMDKMELRARLGRWSMQLIEHR